MDPRSSLSTLAVTVLIGALTACAGESSSTRGDPALALVDVNGDTTFDQVDLQLFAEAFGLAVSLAPSPAAPGDSRYDLNGDGHVGGAGSGRFDLDETGSANSSVPQYSTVAQVIEGLQVHLNENTLTDLEILCYYAYSPLYRGDSNSRRAILGAPQCIRLEIDVTMGDFTGGSASLTVVITDGLGTPVRGVFVELAATGGTVSPVSGMTDENGTVAATVTPESGSSSVTVLVAARTGLLGDILGTAAVQASVGGVVPPPACAVAGGPLDFLVDNNPATIFWAQNSRINPTDPNVDQSQIKLLFQIPENQLPIGVTAARIRIQPLLNAILPYGGHVDTAFRISAVDPSDLGQFSGGGQAPLTLRLRYDPVLCDVSAEDEATLVLGRFNETTQTWQDVCGETADPTAAVREVACANADLSFGIFGVIKRVGTAFNDLTPPTFPNSTFTLASPSRCDICSPPSIDLEWGPATDDGGSGVVGYWIYVDGSAVAFSQDTTANPTVRYTLRSSGTIDTTTRHRYQVQAEDAAGNKSALFGGLLTP